MHQEKMHEEKLCVLHVTALADREALDTLRHTTKVIAALGVGQLLIALEEGRGGEDAKRAAAPGAEVRTLRCAGLSIFGKIRALQLELARLPQGSLYAVHFHGVGACLLGSQALKGTRLHGRVVYSPHLTHAAAPWTAALLGRLVPGRLEAMEFASVTASPTDAQMLSKLLKRSAEVLPHPVSPVYFEAARQEDARPSIVADGLGSEALDVVTRLSVLLNGRDARLPFAWLGAAPARARAQLDAAGIQVCDARHDEEKAQWLSRASAFIHVSSANRLPIAVAQAMAAGVPCLVSDTPAHRALIHHGETGFVCTSERDLLEKLVLLLRDSAERKHVGEAARAEAERRFTLHHFERAILRAYGFSAGKPARTPASGLSLVQGFRHDPLPALRQRAAAIDVARKA